MATFIDIHAPPRGRARARVEAYEASLRRVARQPRPAPNFDTALDEAKRGFEREIVRDSCGMASADEDARRPRACVLLRPAISSRALPVARAPRADLDRHSTGSRRTRSRCASAGTSSLPAAARSTKRAPTLAVAQGGARLPESSGTARLRRRRSARRSLAPTRTILASSPSVSPARFADRAPARRGRTRILARGRALLLRPLPQPPTVAEEMDDLCDYLADLRRRDSRVQPEGPHARLARSADARVASRPRGDRAHRGRSPAGGGRACVGDERSHRQPGRQLAGRWHRRLVVEPVG